MKRILAVIREEVFENVKHALIESGCDGMNVSFVKGRGHQTGYKESYRGSGHCVDLITKVRIELIVKKEDLDDIVDLIIENARTGDVGDGKIFVSDVEEVIRIRTGERGPNAI